MKIRRPHFPASGNMSKSVRSIGCEYPKLNEEAYLQYMRLVWTFQRMRDAGSLWWSSNRPPTSPFLAVQLLLSRCAYGYTDETRMPADDGGFLIAMREKLALFWGE